MKLIGQLESIAGPHTVDTHGSYGDGSKPYPMHMKRTATCLGCDHFWRHSWCCVLTHVGFQAARCFRNTATAGSHISQLSGHLVVYAASSLEEQTTPAFLKVRRVSFSLLLTLWPIFSKLSLVATSRTSTRIGQRWIQPVLHTAGTTVGNFSKPEAFSPLVCVSSCL